MQLGKLLVYFETSPALQLLRARTAPFVIDFLDRQFKQPARIAIPHSDLVAALAGYIEDVQETHPNVLVGKPDAYLSAWCSQETRWLLRFLEAGRDEPVYQLTPHTEDVFIFLDRVLNQDLGFVGTESRLKLVIETLSDLVIGYSDDPDKRLTHLREERDRLQSEIDQIESDGRISKYQPAKIRERFSTLRRTFWTEPARFRSVDLSDFQPNADDRLSAFQQLAAMKRLNWHQMRDRVRHMLMTENAPTLGQLLDVHPAEAGVWTAAAPKSKFRDLVLDTWHH